MKFFVPVFLVAFSSAYHADGFVTAVSSHQNNVGNTKTGFTHRRLVVPSMSSVDAKVEVTKVKGGEATIASSTFNLAKSIIGAGVLSLPSGVAFFSDSAGALVPAVSILTCMGLVAAYTFSLIGKACEQHGATTFKEAWAKSVDPKTAWLISGGITAKCFFASLAYSIIIGDSFTSLADSSLRITSWPILGLLK